MEDGFTAEEQLALIRKMIAEGQKRFAENGITFIFIGILSVLGIAATYLVLYAGSGAIGPIIVWCSFGAAAFAGAFFLARRAHRRKGTLTFPMSMVASIWSGVWIAYLPLMGLSFSGILALRPMLASLCLLFCAAYWSTAKALEFPAMRPMAIGWAGGAILVCLVPVYYAGFSVAALVIAFQIVPGFAMRSRYRRENGPAGTGSHA
jgi:hypothetical protein